MRRGRGRSWRATTDRPRGDDGTGRLCHGVVEEHARGGVGLKRSRRSAGAGHSQGNDENDKAERSHDDAVKELPRGGARPRYSRGRAVQLGPKSAAVLVVASLGGLMMFCWPLVVRVEPASVQHVNDAPFLFMVTLPVLVLVILAQISEGGMDAKALAMLGVLSAVNAALRPLGAGIGGVEPFLFVLVLAGRVFGPGFGFTLGCTSMFASGLLTAGVGPWLPFQMLISGWIGLGAGLLPQRATEKTEIAVLAAYGAVSAYLFGMLMNLWFWPFIAGAAESMNGSLSYVAGAPVLENLHRFLIFTLVTSTAGWDTIRAIVNIVAILFLGPALLTVFRRAVRHAAFDDEVIFADANQSASASATSTRS